MHPFMVNDLSSSDRADQALSIGPLVGWVLNTVGRPQASSSRVQPEVGVRRCTTYFTICSCAIILLMRYVSYPTRGRPDGVAGGRDEMVMLLQASIEIANAERWALEIGDSPPPPSLQQNLRRAAYEVTVVDVLHRVARRYFEQQNFRAIWERPFHTGKRGRPESIDICLFRKGSDAEGDKPAIAGKELRLELGLYSATKLIADCKKLARLASKTLDGFPVIENLVLLWDVEEQPLIKATSKEALARFQVDAKSVFKDGQAFTAVPLLASSIDLFVAKNGASRRATAGLFEVRPSSLPVPPGAGGAPLAPTTTAND